MKISLQATMFIGALFALACFSTAIKGFLSLDEIADATVLADAKGFALFWAFLGLIATAFSVASWWLIRTYSVDEG